VNNRDPLGIEEVNAFVGSSTFFMPVIVMEDDINRVLFELIKVMSRRIDDLAARA